MFFLRSRLSELQHCKIMSYFRNDTWKEDLQLKEDLQKYVGQLFKREEILSFVIRDHTVTLGAFAHSIGCDATKVFDWLR